MEKMNGRIYTTLCLKLEGPLFIGSHDKIKKKEYYYDSKENKVYFYDNLKLQQRVVALGLADQYVDYMLCEQQKTLYDFCKSSNISRGQFNDALIYSVPAQNAIGGDRGNEQDIEAFLRNAMGQPYVPGSSVKGALHTALMTYFMMRNPQNKPRMGYIDLDSINKELQKEFKDKQLKDKQLKEIKCKINGEAKKLNGKCETEFFHTLKLTEDKNDAVNSIMRGIMLADSAPLDTQMILCRKKDIHVNAGQPITDGEAGGADKNKHILIRECLPPGTEVKIPMVLDEKLTLGITLETIREAIRVFDKQYIETFQNHFELQGKTLRPELGTHLFLGGGSGYNSKTVTYTLLGQEKGLEFVSSWMRASFRAGKHEKDQALGISPHTIKYTNVGDQVLPFGLCRVEFL